MFSSHAVTANKMVRAIKKSKKKQPPIKRAAHFNLAFHKLC